MRTIKMLARALWYRYRRSIVLIAPLIITAGIVTADVVVGVRRSSVDIAATPPTTVFGLDMPANGTQPVSAAGHGRIRFAASNKFQMSLNGASYTTLGSSLEDSYLIGTAAGGLPGGQINLTTAGGPLFLLGGDDTMTSEVIRPNSLASTGPWIDLENGNGVSVLSIDPAADGSQSAGLHFKSQAAGAGYQFVTVTQGGSNPLTFNLVSSVLQLWEDQFQFLSSNTSLRFAVISQLGVGADIFRQLTVNAVVFSTTPAFNCTIGDGVVHFGPVTANITAVTMSDGLNGEHCTIDMLKDATASAFTVTASWGANVRVNAATFSTGASSLLVYKFVWDASLATPAWVQESAAVTVP